MSIASKLTKSVRQAKESGVNTNTVETSAESPKPVAQGDKLAAESKSPRPASKITRTPEVDAAIIRFPSHRVWPD